MEKRNLICHKCNKHEWECSCIDKEERIRGYEEIKSRTYGVIFMVLFFTWVVGFGALSVYLFKVSVIFGAIALFVAFILPLTVMGVIAD